MNTEQRMAVRTALSAPHTVITGPPGTGKSQVVTNLVVNAAWRGMKVLFASKNNKAVNVVEARVNGLGNRPVLLRLGSREYQEKLSGYLTQVLAGNPSADDMQGYLDGRERHHGLTARLAELDSTQQQTLDARNEADALDAEADAARTLLGELLSTIDDAFVCRASSDVAAFVRAIGGADLARQGMLARVLWSFLLPRRLNRLAVAAAAGEQSAAGLGVTLPRAATLEALPEFINAGSEWNNRLGAARTVLRCRQALDLLQRSPSFEEIARQRTEITAQIAQNSERLWRDWVQLAPTRLTPAQRKVVADYAATLQLTTAQDAHRVHASVRDRARALRDEVAGLFACWAVTSLSARGRLPFEPGYFDLVVIDEASQCDIASVLPLLYRAKRSVIIGDPQQLKHISAISRPRDSELQYRHGLVETRLGWMYSAVSLYDVAAGVVPPQHIVNLRDHHRSHADIIEFSNRAFYEGRLRVATRHEQLKRPRKAEPGVVWQDVRGKVVRPTSGGAQNALEARAVVDALEDLLVRRAYTGTVGVVTPFRAQAQLLKKLVGASDALMSRLEQSDLLVDTVHSFQGDERDVMFFSPVVSLDTPVGALGFLRSNGNLFNVAITRARGLLHVVGDQEAASTSGVDYLANFAAYAAELVAAPHGRRDATDVSSLGPDYPVVARPDRVSDWERVLYRALFAAGVRAIPQYAVEQYDLDFAVIVGERRLNIEVDGERYHRSWTGELCARDQLRSQRLMELGWEVKRFWVYEVRDRMEECVEFVAHWVRAAQDAVPASPP
jgi:very-short-patch-repair endonuclease